MNNVKKLSEIPFSKLPKTLMKRIIFPNIGKIEVLHKNQSKLYITTMAFVNNYAPSIKYYNDNLQFVRKISPEQVTPVVIVYNKEMQEVEKIDSGSVPHHTELLNRLLQANNKIAPATPGQIIDLKSVEGAQIIKEEEIQKQQQQTA